MNRATVTARGAGRALLERLDRRVLLNGDDHVAAGSRIEDPGDATLSSGELALLEVQAALVPLSELPILHSNAASPRKIFLDFDGHVTSGTGWNTNYGKDIHSPAYDLDGDIFTYNATELDRIRNIWARTAEDFAPFHVDVTTEEPPPSAFTVKATAQRVLFTTNIDDARVGGTGEAWRPAAGGVAYIDSWSNATKDVPCWVFNKGVGGTASHEVGHTFGLHHDGTTSGDEYYNGHGSGDTAWTSIMGGGSQPLDQWSRGEYPLADNFEDDLAIITASKNQVSYRADDYGSTFASAAPLAAPGATSVSITGIIERATDVDVFTFATAGGSLSLSLDGASYSNLDILAELRDAAGQLIASSNPVDRLYADLNVIVSAGTYYLSVSGVGKGNPAGTGYSDYGSLGQFTITGTIAGLHGGGLRGDYFAGSDFAGSPLLVRQDSSVDFDWSAESPHPALDRDAFAVRWTGTVVPQYSHTYTFYTLADDGVRLWVNEQLLIDRWGDNLLPGDANLDGFVTGDDYTAIDYAIAIPGASGWENGDFNGDGFISGDDYTIIDFAIADRPVLTPAESSAQLALLAGVGYDIRLEYYQRSGPASASLLWSSPGVAKQVIAPEQLYPPPTAAQLPHADDFDDGVADFFEPRSGTWSVAGGRYHVTLTAGAQAVSTLSVLGQLPQRLDLRARMNADAATSGFLSNGFIVFDYVSETDFKYAGAYVGAGNVLRIGRRTASGWVVDASVAQSLSAGVDYDLRLTTDGGVATLWLNGVQRLSHNFGSPLNAGAIGIGTNNSKTHFDNLLVQEFVA